jgi:tetratricopeptide (TPR) repeat protein
MPRLALILALALPAIAPAEQRWLRASSPNFELYTTAGERKARETITYFEQVRGFFLRTSGARPSTKAPVRVVAFTSLKDYRPYSMGEGTAGYAGGGPDRDVIVMSSVMTESYYAAVHEFVHILLKPNKHLPLCLNEGQADLFSTLRPLGNKIVVGEVPRGRGSSLAWLKWLDLETLFAVDHDSPYYTTDKREIFYAESWALAHMLFLAPGYRDKTMQFMRQINTGAAPADVFQQIYGKSMRQALADLQSYIRMGSLPVMTFDAKLEKAAEEPEIRPATPLESGLALASLLTYTDRRSEARQAFEALAKDNPTSPEVPEALGYLAWREGRINTALDEFARAATLGSRSARMYEDYGQMLRDPARQAELLGRAVELDPTLRDARFALANALLAQRDFEGTVRNLSAIKQVEPERAFRYFYVLAFAYYGLGNPERAREDARRAAKYAAQEADRTALDQLNQALEDRPAQPPAVEEPAPERPTLSRAAPPAAEPAPPAESRPRHSSVEGTLTQLDCLGDFGRIRVTVKGATMRFLMTDPNAIVVRGTSDGKVEFTCGPQKPRHVLVEYEPFAEPEQDAAGEVRAIEFR